LTPQPARGKGQPGRILILAGEDTYISWGSR